MPVIGYFGIASPDLFASRLRAFHQGLKETGFVEGQNVAMNISDKAKLLAGIYRVLKPGGLFTSTEYSVGPGGDIIFPVPWAYDASINFLDREDVMRVQYHAAGFRILEWVNYSNAVIEHHERILSTPPNKLTIRLVSGEDMPQRQANSRRNLMEERLIYWMITAERPKLLGSVSSARHVRQLANRSEIKELQFHRAREVLLDD
jgi:hypothetical protein